ncbi:MAG: D-2-hydroxyacid dehydrogenase [Oscillospiraceae bacterium]|jgi:glycerate dehydrogenase|nr:D-2-hydroxyacid dehydrogenase [Oscillospiraceae bacterium]
MKIVVLDGYTENPGDLSWGALETLGELTVYDRTPAGQAAERIVGADAVYTNKTPITAADMDAAPSVRFIGVLATGYNIVDTDAAKARGIPVCNVPTYGTAAVAQFTFALLLELCHHAAHHAAEVQRGQWRARGDFCFWDYPLVELQDKTMGIIGYGRIGQAVGRIAKAFGMRVLAYDAYVSCEESAELDELLSQSDVISLHCPLTPDTRHIINAGSIAKMKPGVMIVNDSRGPLIDESALREALIDGRVYAAAVDVVSKEPIEINNPLFGLPNCIITPHIAWAPKESRQRLMDVAVDNLRKFIEGRPQNVVNP